jgi:hypothetical protein
MIRVAIVTLLASLAISLASHAAIAGGETFAPIFVQQTNKHTQRMVEAAEVLRSKSQDEWTELEQQHYLVNALWSVYSAVFAYSLLHDELPSNLHAVVDEGLLAVWPGNPYNNWAPMAVNASGTSFSAGNITLQLCPPSEYTIRDGGQEVALSFELGIFGPTAEYASNYGNADVNAKNRSWAMVPAGTVYMIGGWAEPADEIRAKLAESQAGGNGQ